MSVQISHEQVCERLSSISQPLDNPDADIRDRDVRDAEGESIGQVVDLLVDPGTWHVRLMEVRIGGVMGIAAKHHLVPIDVVRTVGDDHVEVSVPPEAVRESPEYRRDFSPEDELDHYADLYSWYRVQPYWQDGYRYPPFPTMSS